MNLSVAIIPGAQGRMNAPAVGKGAVPVVSGLSAAVFSAIAQRLGANGEWRVTKKSNKNG
jgi:hypothetical protein